MKKEEALETIRRCCPKVGDSQCDFESALRELIPELRESEDERIRKKCIAIISKWTTKEDRDECIAYLEKQKKQEPDWSEEDEENFKWFDKFFRAESVIAGGRDIPQDKYLWFKSLHPQSKQEWSEEDKRILKGIIGLIDHNQHYNVSNKEMLEWLKSLRP